MEAFLMEKYNIKQVAGPVDGNTAAITGTRVGMKGYRRIAFVIQLGDSTTALAVTPTLRQHNAASGGSSKDLSVANPYFKKVGAATKFTKVEPTVAAAAYDLTTDFANDEGILVLEVLAEDLDVNNNFSHVSVDLADTGAAKMVSVLAFCEGGAKPIYGTDV